LAWCLSGQPAQRLPVSARQNAGGDQVAIFLPTQSREVIIPEQRPQPGTPAAPMRDVRAENRHAPGKGGEASGEKRKEDDR